MYFKKKERKFLYTNSRKESYSRRYLYNIPIYTCTYTVRGRAETTTDVQDEYVEPVVFGKWNIRRNPEDRPEESWHAMSLPRSFSIPSSWVRFGGTGSRRFCVCVRDRNRILLTYVPIPYVWYVCNVPAQSTQYTWMYNNIYDMKYVIHTCVIYLGRYRYVYNVPVAADTQFWLSAVVITYTRDNTCISSYIGPQPRYIIVVGTRV